MGIMHGVRGGVHQGGFKLLRAVTAVLFHKLRGHPADVGGRHGGARERTGPCA